MRTILLLLIVFVVECCFANEVFLELAGVPADGFVVCPLDLTPAANWLAATHLDTAEFFYGDKRIDAVFVSGSAEAPLRGTFVAVLPDDVPRGKPCRLQFRLRTGFPVDDNARPQQIVAGAITFDAKKLGGLPSLITFANGKTLETMKWFDRLHDPDTGSWNIANEKIELVVDKPFLKVVRSLGTFKRGNDSPPSKPAAEYQWFIFPQKELVYVLIHARQEEPTVWKEKHFLELHIPDGSFGQWFGDDKPEPGKSGTFTGTKQSQTFSRYSGFRDASNNVIAAIAPGTILYDGLNDFGPYLMPRGNDAWQAWSDTKHRLSSWYWIGNTSEPAKTLQAAYEAVLSMPRGEIVIPALESPKDWKSAALNDLFLSGNIASKEELERLRTAEKLPEGWHVFENDDLGMMLEITGKREQLSAQSVGKLSQQVGCRPPGGNVRYSALESDVFASSRLSPTQSPGGRLPTFVLPKGNLLMNWGVALGYYTSALLADDSNNEQPAQRITENKKGKGLRLLSLVDKKTKTILSARESVPLFTAEVLDKKTGKTFTITSDDGWENVQRKGKEIFLSNPVGLPGAEKLEIFFEMPFLEENNFMSCWGVYKIDRYQLRNVTLAQIALRNFGQNMKAFYPHASGVVTENPVGNELHWKGTYPSGWCSMQYTAVYDETKNVGLYIAADSIGSYVRDIRLDADSAADSLTVRFERPLPLDNLNNPMRFYAEWRTFQGDWYDAAVMYRDDVRSHADWYPRKNLGPDGRTDTPQWMKELSVWALCSDPPEKMPETMRKFTDALGIPTAVHWYNWHQIPFDNDYPHFFPAKEGFKEAVAEIQKNGDCYVMPYINGHLWDTRDKVLDDFQFTSVALPATAKKEDGKPYIETYGSKESDGSPVELAAMCPATDVWKNKVSENVLRLLNECGVAGVYVDQVAAQHPNLCFDPTHGHPLAGGDWWNKAYWEMFEKIRNEMPKDRMLTTECNAEPFVNIFDGYLTWHFQYQDQVPAFAAVYGGAVQMFGRAYRGGPSQVLADRMKAAQQLVYGEQIGWIDPHIVDNAVLFPFFKEIVLMRYKYRDYFYKGEMIRPPKFSEKIPTVTADWQWSGEWIITTDAVLTGAWRKTDEEGKTTSAVFFFVNVSDKPITSRVKVRLDEVGLESKAFDEPLTFEPGVPLAIEVGK